MLRHPSFVSRPVACGGRSVGFSVVRPWLPGLAIFVDIVVCRQCPSSTLCLESAALQFAKETSQQENNIVLVRVCVLTIKTRRPQNADELFAAVCLDAVATRLFLLGDLREDAKGEKYDIFLSHLQRNAQDTIISLQMFLKEVRPGLKFFIDVDVDMTDGLHETLRPVCSVVCMSMCI